MVAGWVMGQYDYSRLLEGKRPVFARVTLYRDDGGSVDYLGMGYAVTAHNQMWDMVESPTNNTYPNVLWVATRYRVGPTLHYLIPFISREHLSFIAQTNMISN
jgi:hypothetical protein